MKDLNSDEKYDNIWDDTWRIRETDERDSKEPPEQRVATGTD
jgi:hypothetical protein